MELLKECRKYIIFGILIAIFVGYAQSDSQATNPDTRRIITRHEQYRGLMNNAADMVKMRWSNNLEKIAVDVVQLCPKSREELLNMPQINNLGVNVGSVPYPTPIRDGFPEDIQTSIIDQWGTERSNYRTEGGCPSSPCDAWWQVVWSKASQIGCSLKICANSTIMVCVYNSRADPEQDHPFKIGPPCSACPDGFKLCENDMCTLEEVPVEEPEYPSGTFDKTIDRKEEDSKKDEMNDSTANNKEDGNPYAPASGDGDESYNSTNTDSASGLTLLYATSISLLFAILA